MAFSFDSRVRYSEVDSDCMLAVTALTNYFQDCSVFHSQAYGLGVDYLAEHHLAWVLSSWQIIIDRMPMLNEEVKVYTWAYDMKAFYGYRNFKLEGADGETLAYANSVWVLMDTVNGRPVKVPQEFANIYGFEPRLDMECCERRIPIPPDMTEVERLVVPHFFIDSNQHMNNEKYIMLAQELLPQDFKIRELRVEYKKEAKLGDTIVIYKSSEADKVTIELSDEAGKPYAVIAFYS